MSGRKSKDKGSAAERELCKLLGGIFNGPFIRSANSGAFVGGKNASRKANLSENQIRGVKADIVPPDFMPRLVVESKWYQEFAYHNLITPGAIPLLDEWIDQTLDAVDPGDFWMLCFRANRRSWSVCFDVEHAADFAFDNYLFYRNAKGARFVVTDLEQFAINNREVILTKSAGAA